jgi:hypothetical protein
MSSARNLGDSFLAAAAGSTLTIEHTAFTSNQCIGGAGGNGGADPVNRCASAVSHKALARS